MYARSVDEAAARLRELRQEECGDLALAAVSLGLAFAATQIRPAFAMPFLLGGVVVGVRGTIALSAVGTWWSTSPASRRRT